jgi:hypothetical protein
MAAFSNALRSSFINMSASARLLFLLLLVFFVFVIGLFIAGVLAVPIFGKDMMTILQLMSGPSVEHLPMLRFFQITQTLFLFLIPALIASWLFSAEPGGFISVNRKPSRTIIVLVSLSMILAIPMMNAVAIFNMNLKLPQTLNGVEVWMKDLEENAAMLTRLFLGGRSSSDLIINFFMIAILPALGEEFLFRGVLQRLLIQITKSSHAGIIIGAFLFSFVHFQFYGFIPRFLLGLYFGYLLLWSTSIWIPVMGHLVNNGFAVVYYHFARQSVGETPMDYLGTDSDSHYIMYLSVFLTAVTVGAIFLNQQAGKRN